MGSGPSITHDRPVARLSPLDAAFLDVEGPNSHMHVGWAAEFLPPADGPRPTYDDLRMHIESRLGRAPRYRQRLAEVPLGLDDPVWIDDDEFDADRHIRPANHADLGELADAVFSAQLPRDRPPWEIWIADELPGGGLGVVGKVHHCMVDGLAAWDLAGVLLDPTPEPPAAEPDRWRARPAPSALQMLAAGLRSRASAGAELASRVAGTARSPSRLVGAAAGSLRRSRVLARAALPPASATPLNQPLSAHRRLVRVRRPLGDLSAISARYQVSLNDVLLGVCAGAMRALISARGEQPTALKTMVPASVRRAGREGALGNEVSAVFVELPADEPDPVRRLRRSHALMRERKRGGDHHVVAEALDALRYVPRPLRQAGARLAASSPRTFNLTISNIPGPTIPLYMLGCRLETAHPVVPLPERHALAIGMTTINDHACFGLYVDPVAVPDAEVLVEDVHDAIDELLRSAKRGGPERARARGEGGARRRAAGSPVSGRP